MIFEIVYDKQPVKFLNKVNKKVSNRILDKIEETLSHNPVPYDKHSKVYD